MAESVAKKAIKGTIWSGFDRFGVMMLQFFVNIVLTRLLMPSDFGAIGMLQVFIVISNTFIDAGFGSALIQKKSPTETDYSTVFIWNIMIGVACYGLLYFFSPLIAKFYRLGILENILKVIGFALILNSAISIQVNRLQKMLKFNVIASTNIISYVISSSITVVMAFKGYGVWSLVSMSISQPILRLSILFFITHWVPKMVFSKRSFKELFSFGGYLFIGNILESIFKNIQGFIIGRKFAAVQMGYYVQADRIDQIVSYSVPQVISSVMYPVFSGFQDNKKRLSEIIQFDFRVLSFAIYPLLTIMIVAASEIITLLYGDNWIQSAIYLQILCCGGFFYSINNIAYYAVAACGKSKSLLKAGICKWLMFGVFILIGMNFGMNGIMWAMAINYLNIFCINCGLANKYIGIKHSDILLALLPSSIVCIICGLILKYSITLNGGFWIVWCVLFAVLYFAVSFVINKRGLSDIQIIYNKIRNK